MSEAISVERAARDRHVCASDLREWLTDAGYPKPPTGTHCLPVEVIDHVIAERRAWASAKRHSKKGLMTGTITARVAQIVTTAPVPLRLAQIEKASRLPRRGVLRALYYAKRLGLVRTVHHPSGRSEFVVWVGGEKSS